MLSASLPQVTDVESPSCDKVTSASPKETQVQGLLLSVEFKALDIKM